MRVLCAIYSNLTCLLSTRGVCRSSFLASAPFNDCARYTTVLKCVENVQFHSTRAVGVHFHIRVVDGSWNHSFGTSNVPRQISKKRELTVPHPFSWRTRAIHWSSTTRRNCHTGRACTSWSWPCRRLATVTYSAWRFWVELFWCSSCWSDW